MYSIAIDGPAGSGKSTIAKLIADKLNISYIDTGSMYRALALKTLKLNIRLEDEKALGDMLDNTDIDYEEGKIYIDGEDVSDKIRGDEVSALASDISKNFAVREYLVHIQREISKRRSVVMEGRDIGTVVLPHADYKFYLTADLNIRAKRRYEQLLAKGEKTTLEEVQESIKQRDTQDMNRKNSPLKQAQDALLVDNSHMDLNQTLEYILNTIRGKNAL
ncbi:Cytidylate kinase [Peptoniphilus sp. ING2-D1G]|nr:Cytidylate kinase [Peptoniphilus sp. ING2-D1G]